MNIAKLVFVAIFLFQPAQYGTANESLWEELAPIVRQFCADCHGRNLANAGVDLERLTNTPDLANQFRLWEKVIHALDSGRMPPKDAEQIDASKRRWISNRIRSEMQSYIDRFAGDPGPSALRRLSAAEYSYTLKDLTGLDLAVAKSFVNDAVGGAGFTNVGHAQFVDSATFERYLEAGKIIARHAVIGSGPIHFFSDPGQSGRELSAVDRIVSIYRENGFRTGAGEGAEPFGLDKYARAFLVAWRYLHRESPDSPPASLESLAIDEGLSVRFCQHIWNVLNSPAPEFPTSLIIDQWRAIPGVIEGVSKPDEEVIRKACTALGIQLREWQSLLASAAGDEEEASVLTDGPTTVSSTHSLQADINWPKAAKVALFELSVAPASLQASASALVLWKNARLRFRNDDGRRSNLIPLIELLDTASRDRLAVGTHPKASPIGRNDFVLAGESKITICMTIPDGNVSGQLLVDVELDTVYGENRIVRCRIADGAVEGETAAEIGATSTLLADPTSEFVQQWREGVANFARLLPEVSQREPAPSDRDPIPMPFDNSYNKPERNLFHTAIKYHRDDRFLVEHMLDDPTRLRLDRAWADLLLSFDYHYQFMKFLNKKYSLNVAPSELLVMADLQIDQIPDEARQTVRRILDELHSMRSMMQQAQPSHMKELIVFAACAWRRTLSQDEIDRLEQFYADARQSNSDDHDLAVRATIARILVSPAFLYIAEDVGHATNTPTDDGRTVPLPARELANRLSYFLWSSMPDDELLVAARTGHLQSADQISMQVRRMLRDPKAQRLATEFFGQWLGFYRFDEFRGIDIKRFPEFDDRLKADMHREAVLFFDHIVRDDRPVREVFSANYGFLNSRLVRHYGVNSTRESSEEVFEKVVFDDHTKRGGALGLGAIHAVTSAPLRTSAVKRGDWVLRRLLGTPVPPPPADAGSIAADDVLNDGLSVHERLAAHRRDAACQNCHSRIDPLGFALENFDVIGRWRTQYRDGRAIEVEGDLQDGTRVAGYNGLLKYLERERANFDRAIVGKLLGYAVGRSELLSDRPLIDGILKRLETNNRFSEIVVSIVTSKQFSRRRLEKVEEQ